MSRHPWAGTVFSTAVLSTFAFAPLLTGQVSTTTWNGSANNQWSTGTNWSTGEPGALSDAVFPAPVPGTGGTIVLSAGEIANSLAFNAAYTLNGGTLTLSTGNAGSGNVTVAPATTAIISSSLIGTGALNKLGTGTLALTGANTYSGGTLVSGGTLSVSSGGSISNTANLIVNSGGAADLASGTITARNLGIGYNAAGTSTVTVGNAGILTVGNTDSGTAAGAGNLVFIGGNSNGSGGNGGTAGNGILTVNAGGAVNVAAAGIFPNQAIYLGGYGGTGVINLNGGTLTTGRNIESGTSGNSININGGTFRLSTANISVQNNIPVSIQDNGAIFDTNGFTLAVNSSLNHGGAAATDGGLIKNGLGTLYLGATGTFNGLVTLNAGTLSIGNGVTLNNNISSPAGTTSAIVFTGANAGASGTLGGNMLGSGTVNFSTTSASQIVPALPNFGSFTGTVGIDTSGTTFFPAVTSGAGAKWVVNGGGTGTGSGSGSFLFTNQPNGSTVQLGELSGNGRIGSANNASTTWAIGALNTNSTFSGTFLNNFFGSGTAAVAKVGTGTLTLSGVSAYTGATTITGGTLVAANNSALGANNNALVFNGGTLSINDGITLTKNFSASAGTTSAVVFAGAGTLSGSLTGTGRVDFSSSAGPVPDVTIPILPTFASFGGTIGVNTANNSFYPSVTSGAGAKWVVIGGSITNPTQGNGGFLFSNVQGSTIQMGELSGNGRIGSANGAGTNWTIGALNTDSTFSGTIFNNYFGGVAAVTKVGTGTLNLTGPNPYTGGTLVTGGLLSVTGGGSISNTANLFVNNGGNVDITNGTITAQDFGVGYNAAGTSAVTVGSNGVLNIGTNGDGMAAGASNLVFIGGSSNGSGGGGGTAGTGILTINNGGTVNVAAGGTFPNDLIYLGGYGGSGTINLNTGGVLATARGFGTGAANAINFNGGTLRLTSATFATQNGVAFTLQDNGAVIDTNGFNATLGNALVHGGAAATDGGLTKLGAGTLTLSAANSYTGATTLTGGAVVAANNNALGANNGAVAFNGGGLTVNNNVTLTKAYAANAGTTSAVVFTGNGALNGAMTGTGRVNFSSVTNISPVTTPTLPTFTAFNGTVGVDTTNPFFFPIVNSGAGAKWEINGGSANTAINEGFLFTSVPSGSSIALGGLSGSGRIGSAFQAATTWEVGALNTNSTFSGVFLDNTLGNGSGTAAVTKVGTGALTLSGANGHSGPTRVNSGSLILSGANTMRGSTVPAGGSLVISNPQALQNSTLVMNAGETGVVSFTTPAATLGGLSGSRDLNLGTAAVSIGNNNNSTSYSGNLSGGAGLTKVGTGALTLSGASTYNGPTNISAGTLRLGGGDIPDNLTIMPLGDSITDGQANSAATAGYRGFLYNILAGETTGTKFVGSSTVTPGNLPAGQQNHEGHGGYRIDQTNANLAGNDGTAGNNGGFWLAGGGGTGRPELNPDVILLHIGTNDILQGTSNQATLQTRLDALLANIFDQTPNSKVLIADIIPILNGNNPTVTAYNNTVVNTLAASYAAMGRDISVVDMNTAFPAGGMSGDAVHPVALGYSFMADQWYNGLLAEYPGNVPASLPVTSTVTVAAGATLDVNSNIATIGPLAGAGQVTLGSGSLTVTNTAGNNTTFAGVISGTGSLTKTGPARLTLTNTSTYTGATSISGGALIVSATGNIASSSSVTVAAGGTLGGNGRVSAITLQNGGTIAPGESIGTLFGSSLTWNSGGKMAFELSNANNSSDLLSLTGNFGVDNLNGIFQFDFQNTGFSNGMTPTLYTLVNFGSSTPGLTASNFSYTNLNGTGTFQLTPTSLQFSLAVVPEPGRAALLGLAALLMLGRRRRRK